MNKYSTIYNQSWTRFKLVSFIPKRCAARPAAGSFISCHCRASSLGCSLAASGQSGLALLRSTSVVFVLAPAARKLLSCKPAPHLLVHYQYGMKRVIRIRDRWGTQPWQSLPLAIQGQGLCWRNPYTKAPSSIQDTASLRFCFGGQQLLVLACSCSLVSLPSMRTPAPPSCR